MQWIEIAEDPPDMGIKVLVCDEFNSFVSLGRMVEVTDDDEPIFEMMNIEGIEIDTVPTHWMPLPLPVGEYGYT